MSENIKISDQVSPFFKLPAELRNRIYEDVLMPFPAFIRVVEDRGKIKEGWMAPLLRTCRQIKEEAIGIFLARNEFVAASGSSDMVMANWLQTLSEKARLCVRKIYITSGCCDIYGDKYGYCDNESVKERIEIFYQNLVNAGVMIRPGIVLVKVKKDISGYSFLKDWRTAWVNKNEYDDDE